MALDTVVSITDLCVRLIAVIVTSPDYRTGTVLKGFIHINVFNSYEVHSAAYFTNEAAEDK